MTVDGVICEPQTLIALSAGLHLFTFTLQNETGWSQHTPLILLRKDVEETIFGLPLTNRWFANRAVLRDSNDDGEVRHWKRIYHI